MLLASVLVVGISLDAPKELPPQDYGPKYEVQLLTGALLPKDRPPPSAPREVMTKKNGKRYLCHLPTEEEVAEPTVAAKQAATPHVSSYLKQLKGTCFYRLEGWWTYEYCFQKSLRQFHQEKVKASANAAETTQVTQEYTLGAYWTAPPSDDGGDDDDDDDSAWASRFRGELRDDPKKRKYWWSLYGNGTECDLSGKPRETEVRLQCAPGEPSFLASVEEVSTCRYLVHFSTPLICKHPAFAENDKPEKIHYIKCEPIDDDGNPIPLRKGDKEKKAKAKAAAAAAEKAAAAAAASAGAAPLPSVLAYDLGQAIVHYKYNYRGVIVGYDRKCRQTEAWIRSMGVDALKHGRSQPFYQVLADTRDRPGAQITYVAQENIIPDSPSAPPKHPMTSELFAGFDSELGRFIPSPELRARYPLEERPDFDAAAMPAAVAAATAAAAATGEAAAPEPAPEPAPAAADVAAARGSAAGSSGGGEPGGGAEDVEEEEQEVYTPEAE